MPRTVFIVCPSCRLVVSQVREDGVSNTTRTAEQPCPKCQRAAQRQRAEAHAASHDALDRTGR
jgi:hypothetical protein